MPRYTYECDRCGWEGTLFAYSDQRDAQQCDECGLTMKRLPHYTSITIGVPAGFKTMFSDVHGIPGSPQREQFEKDVRSGEIAFAGKGSRWI